MTSYKLYYHPNVPLTNVITARNPPMHKMFDAVNEYVDAYHAGMLDRTNLETYSIVGPNLVQANVIARDLQCNPVAKPFLLNEKFIIETGDTRYLALTVNPHITHVACLISTRNTLTDDWQLVHDKGELASLLNIPVDWIMMHTPTWYEGPLDWIEFTLPQTVNVSLDLTRCRILMDNYLQSQLPGWRMTQDWLLEEVPWSNFSS